MFKKRTECFIGFETMRRSRVVLDPRKHLLLFFLNSFKNIPGKACVNSFHNNYAFVNIGNRRTKKLHTNEECFIS